MKSSKIISKQLKYFFIFSSFLSLLILNTAAAQQNQKQDNKQTRDTTLIMRREMIHSRSHLVMPFDMNKVTHYFIDTNSGGVLKIKAKNPGYKKQINLIREHLKKELDLFSNADFRDPKTLHGMHMPGLKVLAKSKGKFKVKYKELPLSTQLTFSAKDSKVINALHVWFAAQLKDHGKNERSHE